MKDQVACRYVANLHNLFGCTACKSKQVSSKLSDVLTHYAVAACTANTLKEVQQDYPKSVPEVRKNQVTYHLAPSQQQQGIANEDQS